MTDLKAIKLKIKIDKDNRKIKTGLSMKKQKEKKIPKIIEPIKLIGRKSR